MKIAFAVLMLFLLVASPLICMTLFNNICDDEEDMEEQARYLEEWKGKKWIEKKQRRSSRNE